MISLHSATQSLQMKTPGPAINLLTLSCVLPQKEHRASPNFRPIICDCDPLRPTFAQNLVCGRRISPSFAQNAVEAARRNSLLSVAEHGAFAASY